MLKMYKNGEYLCDVSEELVTLSALPDEKAEADRYLTLRKDEELSFTANVELSKAFRRLTVCRSRKRFVKLLMSKGWDRNRANKLAKDMRAAEPGKSYGYYWTHIMLGY